jgi:hypothetical protein
MSIGLFRPAIPLRYFPLAGIVPQPDDVPYWQIEISEFKA